MRNKQSLAWWALSAAGVVVIIAILFLWHPNKPNKAGSFDDEPTSSSSTGTAAAPVMPDTARQNSSAGAEAFIRYYFDLLNYSHKTNTSNRLRKTYDVVVCKPCAAVAENIDRKRENDRHLVGGEYSIKAVFVDNDPVGGKLVEVHYHRESAYIADSKNKQIEDTRAAIDDVVFVQVSFDKSAWKILMQTKGPGS